MACLTVGAREGAGTDGISRWGLLLNGISIVLLALALFGELLRPGVVLFSTDNNIGNERLTAEPIPYGFLGAWSSSPLLGGGGCQPLNLTMLLLWGLPLKEYMNWVHAVDLGLASWFLALFFRGLGISWLASVGGWLTAFWVGTNCTLIYAGHTGKFGLLVFAAAALWCAQEAVRTKRMPWTILTGGALGGMFLEQQDVALFVGMVLGTYIVFANVFHDGWRISQVAVRLIPMGLVAALTAGGTMLSVYFANTTGVVAMSEEDPGSKWEYCTQWSQPPDETIDFIAPGYMGWRTGDPDGPYWGRMGRSADWARTRQGFMNLRLDSVYVGAVPVCFALFAAVWAVVGRRSSAERQSSASRQACVRVSDERARRWRAEILFWASAAAITLLLSYGKFFPLYALFYKLPFVNSIRNPNKFLHVFQLALGVLTAYGLDLAMRTRGGCLMGGGQAKTNGQVGGV